MQNLDTSSLILLIMSFWSRKEKYASLCQVVQFYFLHIVVLLLLIFIFVTYRYKTMKPKKSARRMSLHRGGEEDSPTTVYPSVKQYLSPKWWSINHLFKWYNKELDCPKKRLLFLLSSCLQYVKERFLYISHRWALITADYISHGVPY